MFSYILVIQVHRAQLAQSALLRLHSNFRPTTLVQYTRMYSEFLGFIKTEKISPYQVNIVIILSNMEFVHQKGFHI